MSEQPIAGESSVNAGPSPATARAGAGEQQALATGQAAAGDQEQAPEASPWSDPRLPWEGKPRKADIACWAAITLSGLYYLAILPWRASLVGTHPVISELLNGSTEAIISGAAFAKVGHGSLIIVLLAAIPGLMKFDLIYWWAGRLWGEKVLEIFLGRSKRQRRRSERFMARVNRWGPRFTWPAVLVAIFLPIPQAIIYAVAGVDGHELGDVPDP